MTLLDFDLLIHQLSFTHIFLNTFPLRLPDEVGHLSQLAVLNLAGNYIPHLPVSFIKLKVN